MNESIETVQQVKSTAINLAMQFGPKVVVAIVILAIGVFVGRWVGGVMNKMLVRLDLDITVRQLLVRLVRVHADGDTRLRPQRRHLLRLRRLLLGPRLEHDQRALEPGLLRARDHRVQIGCDRLVGEVAVAVDHLG